METPNGWREIPITEILTDSQCQEVLDIINGESDSITRVRKLQAYLLNINGQLQAQGIEPDFMAYAIEYQALQLRRKGQ